MKRLSSFLAFAILTLSINANPDLPIVKTKNGLVKGVTSNSFSEKPYKSFYAIPYAQPPLGDLRFNFPEPVQDWSFIRDATRDGPACIQIQTIGDIAIGEEDCLWLSVYTPELPTKPLAKKEDLKPVMVWIHGGRFTQGTGRESFYSPTYMMDQGDIVVVSLQYRLGVMGWLSTNDAIIPGNFGYHDQVLGLKWVQDNIHLFGGDKDRVTLVGQSAGGASVHSHLVSPLSKGLVHGVIAISGTSNTAWNSRFTNHRKIAEEQAKLVGCPDTSSEEILDCLRKVDARTLTLSQSDLYSLFIRTPAKIPLTPFLPRMDSDSPRPFFPKDPRQALKEGDYATDIPVMMGLTTQEGSWYSTTIMTEEHIKNFEETRMECMHLLTGENVWNKEELDKMYSFYMRDEKFSGKHHKELASFFSDVTFNFEALHAAHLHTLTGKAPVFFYIFGFQGQWSFPHVYGDFSDYGGVSHLDDLRYFMRMPFVTNKTEEELEVVRRYTGYISEFVRTGRPTHGDPDKQYDGAKWEPYTKGRGQVMNIFGKGESGMSRRIPFPKERMQFWVDLFKLEDDWTKDFELGGDESKDEL